MEKIIRIDDHSGLVLEGGGMRGVFTCGVLDSFMDRGIRFPYTIGVSAGACNGLSYMSGQRGRAKYSNIDLLEKYNYIGLKYLLKKRNIMDFDLLFQEFPEHILPYDYEAYFHCPERYVMVTTNCETGEANYFEEKRSKERVIDIVRASSSLPFVCPITYVDNIPMLDGTRNRLALYALNERHLEVARDGVTTGFYLNKSGLSDIIRALENLY